MRKKKEYSASDLKVKADEFFKKNDRASEVHLTSDGYMFASKNRAHIHASERKLSVFSYQKSNNASVETGHFLDRKASEVIEAITSLTLEEVKTYQSEEVLGKNRKTVIEALEARLLELTKED